MIHQLKNKIIKFRFVFLLFLHCILFICEKDFLISIKRKIFSISKNYLKVTPFYELFNTSINNDIILIFEPNFYHHECTPGYSKYFIELGYKVDILMHVSGIDSFSSFKDIEKIRLFTFINRAEIEKKAKNLSSLTLIIKLKIK